MLRFSVLHHLEAADGVGPDAVYGEVCAGVREAEALGYDTVWIAEHHFSAGKGYAPDPLLLLMRLAGETHRIGLGTAVLPAPLYQPLRLAESVAMADRLCGGRLRCGISSGSVADELRVFGLSLEQKHERLREALLWLRRAWSGEAVTRSPASETDPAAARTPLVPLPAQPLGDLVWLAASTPGAARLAGELGHHLLLPSLGAPDVLAANAAIYREALATAGVALQTRRVQQTVHLIAHDDHATALRLAEPVVRWYYARYLRSGIVAPLADDSLAAIMLRINFVAGGPEAVAERLAALARAQGLTDVAFQARLIGLAPADVSRTLTVAAQDVAPLLAAAAA